MLNREGQGMGQGRGWLRTRLVFPPAASHHRDNLRGFLRIAATPVTTTPPCADYRRHDLIALFCGKVEYRAVLVAPSAMPKETFERTRESWLPGDRCTVSALNIHSESDGRRVHFSSFVRIAIISAFIERMLARARSFKRFKSGGESRTWMLLRGSAGSLLISHYCPIVGWPSTPSRS